jgi:hypothetical protein
MTLRVCPRSYRMAMLCTLVSVTAPFKGLIMPAESKIQALFTFALRI